MSYYVYELIDPRDDRVFYVGKGKKGRMLAEHMAALVRKTGEALELPEPESPFWRGDLQGSDFQAQAIANGLARIGEIVDEARAP